MMNHPDFNEYAIITAIGKFSKEEWKWLSNKKSCYRDRRISLKWGKTSSVGADLFGCLSRKGDRHHVRRIEMVKAD